MYRDARPSIEARIRELDAELTEARDEARRCRANVAPLALQVCPLFTNLRDTMEPVSDPISRGIVMVCLGILSVPALPLALMWRPLRRDLRAARRAERRVERVQAQLDEAQQTLRQLTEGTAA